MSSINCSNLQPRTSLPCEPPLAMQSAAHRASYSNLVLNCSKSSRRGTRKLRRFRQDTLVTRIQTLHCRTIKVGSLSGAPLSSSEMYQYERWTFTSFNHQSCQVCRMLHRIMSSCLKTATFSTMLAPTNTTVMLTFSMSIQKSLLDLLSDLTAISATATKGQTELKATIQEALGAILQSENDFINSAAEVHHTERHLLIIILLKRPD